MFGITLRSAAPAEPFWQLVDAASEFEETPTIRALDYAPHITLARYTDIDPDLLTAALAALAGENAFQLTFDAVCAFAGEAPVLWLSPLPDRRLREAHARLHGAINAALCDPHYLPGGWAPHLTIAAAVRPERRADAQAFMARGIAPFTLSFEVVDCLSWPPVTVLAEQRLA